MIRFLFGPFNGPLANSLVERQLKSYRDRGQCLTYGSSEAVDVRVRVDESWDAISRKLPAGWRPDFVAAYLPYTTVPHGIWQARTPIVGIAPEWALSWHDFRGRLSLCDLAFTDPTGVDRFRRVGLETVHPLSWAFFDGSLVAAVDDAHTNRPDIDVLFTGNLNPAIEPARLPWLGRLARLKSRRVAIRNAVAGDSYTRLLRQAKIVVVFDAAGLPQQPIVDAVAAGAIGVRIDLSHGEVTPLPSCAAVVDVDGERFESMIDSLLDDDAGRVERSMNAKSWLESRTFEKIWNGALDHISRSLPELTEHAKARKPRSRRETLAMRTWQALGSAGDRDSTLVRDLEAATVDEPRSGSLHLALGMALSRSVAGTVPLSAMAEGVSEHFRRSVETDPNHALARLNLAESLAAAGRNKEAIESARQSIIALARSGDELTNEIERYGGAHFEPSYGIFRLAWERAGWSNAGDPGAEVASKKRLIGWQAHRFLSGQTKSLSHAYETFLAEPSTPFTQAALALALGQASQPVEALGHARTSLAANPFDADVARLLFQAHGFVGDRSAQQALIADRQALFRASPTLTPPEPWFFEQPPAGDELTSIVILCCNELDFTRQCVESLLRHTRGSYELVFIDNGSQDGTAEYLNGLKAQKGPVRVHLISNSENMGFAVGCNQGMQAARGSFVVFLNNDIVTTPGWLTNLIDVLVREWPRVGMAGPLSNYAPPPQLVAGRYQSLAELDVFAEKRRAAFSRQCLKVRRLTGFCLIVRRDVLEHVGAFDERFGLGFFEDDDLALRVREAGYQLAVAQNVFVHHYGSRTFRRLEIDTTEQLKSNLDRFRDKWGGEEAGGYVLPEVPAKPALNVPLLTETGPAAESPPADRVPASPGPMRPKVSLSMIVKNEEPNLPGCLESVAGLFDEIVIADTGSTDATRDIARRFGAKVVEFPWIDDFGAARNHSLKNATGRWVVWLDADDRLTEENRNRLRRVFSRLENGLDCYSLKVRSLVNKANDTYQALDQVRLFPNHPDANWEYRVHEQIFPSLRKLGSAILPTDVVIEHVGYLEHATRKRKLERNIRLIELDHQERPEDPFTLFYLGWTSMDLGKSREVLPHFQKALANCSPESSLVRKLYALIAQVHRRIGERGEAYRVCEEALARFSDDAELLHEKAMLCWDKKSWDAVEDCLTRVLRTRSVSYFSSLDEGLQGYRTRHLLGLVYQDQERWSEAETQWRAVTAERPRFLPAWTGLGNLFLRQKRWADLDEVVRILSREGLLLDAAIFRGQSCLSRREFGAAQHVFEEAIRNNPKSIRPRVLLTHAYLQEGRDPEGTERVLREALEVDPKNEAIRHNLAVFLRERGKLVSL